MKVVFVLGLGWCALLACDFYSCPTPSVTSEQRQAARKGAAVNKARALAHAENVLPVVEQIRAGGASLRQIAAELNARGIKTARGGKWHATTVWNIMTTESTAETQAA